MAEIEIWCQSEKSPKFIWFQFVHHRRPQRPTNWSVYNLALNSHSPSQDDHISSVGEIRSLLKSSQSKSALFTFRGCGGSLNHSRLLLFKASLVSELQLPILETAVLIILALSPIPLWSSRSSRWSWSWWYVLGGNGRSESVCQLPQQPTDGGRSEGEKVGDQEEIGDAYDDIGGSNHDDDDNGLA